MKRKFISITVIILLAMVTIITGCKKEEAYAPQSINYGQNESIIFYDSDDKGPPHWTGYRTYYEYSLDWYYYYLTGELNSYWDPHCGRPLTGNCLDDVVITAKCGNEISELAIMFIHYYEAGKIDTFFQTQEYLKLFPDLEKHPEIVQDLKEGVLVLEDRYNENNSSHHYIAVPPGLNLKGLVGEETQPEWIEEVRCVFVIKNA